MHFNQHSELEGKHAFLSASKYHWINYTEEKLADTYSTALAAMRGTQLHEFAHSAIKLGIHQARKKNTLNQYINDALGFRMTPEQVLYYSHNSFGTADAISFRKEKKTDERWTLRIHDLKTGVTATSMKQLMIYVALFCLEYGHKPADLDIELRIYQNDDVEIFVPEYDEITHIMSTIVTFSKRIDEIKAEAFG